MDYMLNHNSLNYKPVKLLEELTEVSNDFEVVKVFSQNMSNWIDTRTYTALIFKVNIQTYTVSVSILYFQFLYFLDNI